MSLCFPVHSRVEALCQTSYGPDNYTLGWEVRNTLSISKFRVYHEGALQGTTFLTNYTVAGLPPCQEFEARVEALCGDDVVMNVQTVTVHTGNTEIRCVEQELSQKCVTMKNRGLFKRTGSSQIGFNSLKLNTTIFIVQFVKDSLRVNLLLPSCSSDRNKLDKYN